MSDVDDVIGRGIAAVQAGELEAARKLLAEAVVRRPEHEQAWLWLASAVDDVQQRRDCLRRVLHINPANVEALHRLLALDAARSIDRTGTAVDPARVQDFACPECGANRRFSAEHGALVCPYCGQSAAIPRDAPPPAADGAAIAVSDLGAAPTWLGQELYRCRNCAGTVLFSARQAGLECPFCGSPFLVASRTPGTAAVPQAIVPFRLDRDAAEQALRRWMATSWRVPAGLARRAAIVQLHGVYVPFWLIGGYALSDADHSVTAPPDRLLNRAFSNLPICAALSLTEATARGLEPFDFDELVAYRPEYLAGWPAEQAQIGAFTASGQALARMDWDPVAADMNLQRRRFVDSCALALLPVFLGAYRHRGRLYAFAVNGQTGRVSARGSLGAAHAGLIVLLLASAVLGLLMLVGLAAGPRLAALRQALSQATAADPGLMLGVAAAMGLMLLWWGSMRQDKR